MLKGVLGDYLIMDEDVREESQTLDVSREGTNDPNFNDCLFVEDDCDEMEEEIEVEGQQPDCLNSFSNQVAIAQKRSETKSLILRNAVILGSQKKKSQK